MPARSREAGEVTASQSGTPVFLGQIVATTTKNNHDTAVPFNNTGDALEGKQLLIQPDAACYVYWGTLNTAAATTANGVLLAAGERVIMGMKQGAKFLAAVAVTGTANVRVWELL